MKLTISEAFRRYGAALKNVNWSVSAWSADGALVVSLWAHHYVRCAEPGVLAFGDRFDRWSGSGNKEFRDNVKRAFLAQSPVRLVLARALEPERVQTGEDASKISKTFAMRDDVIGRVALCDGERYVFEFRRSSP